MPGMAVLKEKGGGAGGREAVTMDQYECIGTAQNRLAGKKATLRC